MSLFLDEKKPRVIFVGRRNVCREGQRYKVYLPMRMNDLWRILHEEKIEVEVYLVPVMKKEGAV